MKVYAAALALILTGCQMTGKNDQHALSSYIGIEHQIPGLQDGAIPQGLAYLPKHNLLLISYYYSDGRP